MRRGGLPTGAEAAYVYDWLRQRRRKAEEEKKRRGKLRKKIEKRSKKRRKDRRKEPSKILETSGNVKKRLKEEKKHLEGIKSHVRAC